MLRRDVTYISVELKLFVARSIKSSSVSLAPPCLHPTPVAVSRRAVPTSRGRAREVCLNSLEFVRTSYWGPPICKYGLNWDPFSSP